MRRHTRLLRSSAFIALLSVLGMSTAAWHTADDDLACAPIVATATNSAPTALAAARPHEQPQHCLLCHWSRWVRSIETNRSQSVAPSAPSARLVPALSVAEAHGERGLSFGRAPPA